jgi:hypothetical protein
MLPPFRPGHSRLPVVPAKTERPSVFVTCLFCAELPDGPAIRLGFADGRKLPVAGAGQSGNRNLECLYGDGPIAQAARPIDERVSSTQRGTQRNPI